jgi:hypothetical protein
LVGTKVKISVKAWVGLVVRVGLGLIRVSEFVVGIGGKFYVRVGARGDI